MLEDTAEKLAFLYPQSQSLGTVTTLARTNPWYTSETTGVLNRLSILNGCDRVNCSNQEIALSLYDYRFASVSSHLLDEIIAERENDPRRKGSFWYERIWRTRGATIYRCGESRRAINTYSFDFRGIDTFAFTDDAELLFYVPNKAAIIATAGLMDAVGDQLGGSDQVGSSSLKPEEVDLLIAVARLQKLASLVTESIIVDGENGWKIEDFSEFSTVRLFLHSLINARRRINQQNWQKYGPILAEAYLQITTKLNDEQITQLMQEFMEQVFAQGTAVPKETPQTPEDSLQFSYDWAKLRARFKLYERIGYMVTALNLLDEVRMRGVEELPKELKQIMPHLTLDVFKELDAYAVARLEEVQNASITPPTEAPQKAGRFDRIKAKVGNRLRILRERVRRRPIGEGGDELSGLKSLMDSYLAVQSVDEIKQRIYLFRAMALIRNVFDHQLEALGREMGQRIPSVNAFFGNGEFIDRIAWFNSQFVPVPNPSYLEKLRAAWGGD